MAVVDLPGRIWKDSDRKILTINLRSTGDKHRDALRMRRVHGLLSSYAGKDRFIFHIYEASRRYHLEFPNSSTGYCADLHTKLRSLLGEDAVQVEPLRLQ
jgi:DNA polymerase-3 subunit alpha